jgi:hypothetical protein
MSLAFWSIAVTSEKPVEVQPPEGYVLNIQQAALENGKNNEAVLLKAETVSIEDEVLAPILGTLRSGAVDQISLGRRYFKHFPLEIILSLQLSS